MVTVIERAHPKALRWALSLLLALGGLAIAADRCGATTGPPHLLTAAPAATLILDVYVQEGRYDATDIRVITSQPRGVGACLTPTDPSTTSCHVELSGHQSLTVNGTRFPAVGNTSVRVPQPSPGGTYMFVYTDEHGQQTQFSLPAVGIAITAPATGQTVPIPAGPRGAPTTTPSGPRTPDLAHQPLTIRYTLPTVPPWPSGATFDGECRDRSVPSGCAIVQGEAYCGNLNTSGPYTCGVFGPYQRPTGVYTLTDANSEYGYGFETFQPGPGGVSIDLVAQWTPEPSGFAGLQVVLLDHAQSSITWGAA